MGRRKIVIPKNKLAELYHSKRFSPAKIGELYNCDRVTVRNRIKELGIELKTPQQARMRYAKFDFCGGEIEKAYILGFRLGDLNVYMPHKSSETIIARCHSTVPVQIELTSKLFCRYGRATVSVSKNGNNLHVNCYLNKSFSFLLPKYNKQTQFWLSNKKDRMLAFTAGYTDAEGNFQINQGRGRFQVVSYDYEILRDINTFLNHIDIHSILKLIGRKGERRKRNIVWNKNVYKLNINRSDSLETFTTIIIPYLRHKLRIKSAKVVLRNISQRRSHGSIR